MNHSVEASMTNTSGLHPLGHAVLVKPVRNELKTERIIVPETVAERSMMVEMHAVVLEVGSEAWAKEGRARAKLGDRVLVSRWCGNIVTGLDGQLYRMVNCEDIFCAVDSPAEGKAEITEVKENVR
jgi:co-chaperonin GroES (HSP10)